MEERYDKYCKDCYYWRGRNGGYAMCCYIFIEDKMRPCPPGEECTVRKEKKQRGVKKDYGAYEK